MPRFGKEDRFRRLVSGRLDALCQGVLSLDRALETL